MGEWKYIIEAKGESPTTIPSSSDPPPLHVRIAGHLCMHHPTHPAACHLLALRSFPASHSLLPSPRIAGVGLHFVLVAVVVLIAFVIAAAVPDVGVRALVPPLLPANRRAASAA
jgi:hypothetical protein